MKKVALAVSIAMISGGAFAGNLIDYDLQGESYSDITVEQNSPGTAVSDGNYVSVKMQYGIDNDGTITQTGEQNKTYIVTDTDAWWNEFEVAQVGDSNKSTVDFNNSYSNVANADVTGDSNITSTTFDGYSTGHNKSTLVLNGDGNNVATSVEGNRSERNTFTVNIEGDGNKVVSRVTTTNSDDNILDIDITGLSNDNNIMTTQTGDDAKITVKISDASFMNTATVRQNNTDIANITYSHGSNNNTLILTQN